MLAAILMKPWNTCKLAWRRKKQLYATEIIHILTLSDI